MAEPSHSAALVRALTFNVWGLPAPLQRDASRFQDIADRSRPASASTTSSIAPAPLRVLPVAAGVGSAEWQPVLDNFAALQ